MKRATAASAAAPDLFVELPRGAISTRSNRAAKPVRSHGMSSTDRWIKEGERPAGARNFLLFGPAGRAYKVGLRLA